MSLSIEQQYRATKAYVIQQLQNSQDGGEILKDRDFMGRLDLNFRTVFGIYAELYGYRFDCLDQLTELILMCGRSWKDRPQDLKELDKQKELNPDWYLSNQMLGGVCYIDR